MPPAHQTEDGSCWTQYLLHEQQENRHGQQSIDDMLIQDPRVLYVQFFCFGLVLRLFFLAGHSTSVTGRLRVMAHYRSDGVMSLGDGPVIERHCIKLNMVSLPARNDVIAMAESSPVRETDGAVAEDAAAIARDAATVLCA